MLIEVAVKKWYDWKPVRRDEVQPGDVAVPSVMGAEFANVRVLKTTPSKTSISIPDGEIERMVTDHEDGVKLRRAGYQAKHEGHGGPVTHGKMQTVASQPAPLKSRKQLIGDHLVDAVMPFHAPAEAIGKVKVIDAPGFSEEERKDLERYLTVRLGG